jgi:hypothetical protein
MRVQIERSSAPSFWAEPLRCNDKDAAREKGDAHKKKAHCCYDWSIRVPAGNCSAEDQQSSKEAKAKSENGSNSQQCFHTRSLCITK